MVNPDVLLAANVEFCTQTSFSMLICPPALATFVVLSYRSIKNGQFVDALPLLLGQLNTVFIWGCILT